MDKYLLAFFAIVLVSMESSVANPYYGGYGQQPLPMQQPYPMAPGGQPCSKNYLANKYQKNLQEFQQERAACQQGNPQYCEKAQKDYQDAQNYWMQYNSCPYP
jgi:hypothetical protein